MGIREKVLDWMIWEAFFEEEPSDKNERDMQRYGGRAEQAERNWPQRMRACMSSGRRGDRWAKPAQPGSYKS